MAYSVAAPILWMRAGFIVTLETEWAWKAAVAVLKVMPFEGQFHKKSYTFGGNIVESLAQTP